MCTPLKIDSFDDWIRYIFEHPVADPAWHWHIDVVQWDEEEHPAQVVDYMTRLFENGDSVLAPFSDAQLNQGLWFLADTACSSHMFALKCENVPLPSRVRCVGSMTRLFSECFAKRCSSLAGSARLVDKHETNPLNMACYMWFDILPYWGCPQAPELQQLDAAFLETMEAVLYVPHDFCRESALHGLGHWHLHFDKQVEEAIETFLHKTPGLSRELIEYAHAALQGAVQ